MTAFLTENVCTFARIAGVVLGLGLLTLVFVGPQTAWRYVRLIALLTGLEGCCPLYSVFGISTRPTRTA